MTQRLTPAALQRYLRAAREAGAVRVRVTETAGGVVVDAELTDRPEEAADPAAASLEAWRRATLRR